MSRVTEFLKEQTNDKATQLDIIQNTFYTEETVYPLFHPVTGEMCHQIILHDGRLHFNMKFLTEGGHFRSLPPPLLSLQLCHHPSRTPTSLLPLLVSSSPISVTSSTSSLCCCHQSVFSSGLANENLCLSVTVRHCILCVTHHL